MGTWSVRQLREYARKLRFQAEVKTAAQAKDYLKKVRTASDDGLPDFTGYPKLLKTECVVDEHGVRYIDQGIFLWELSMRARKGDSNALYDLKKRIRLYGSAQVDYWISRGAAAAAAQ
jgi:hypothetical protein